MAIFSLLPRTPSSLSAFARRKIGKTASGYQRGYHLDTILDTVRNEFFDVNSNGYSDLDTMDTIFSTLNVRARAYVLDTDKESTKEKALTHVLNTKNGIHGIQYINNLIKTKRYKNLMVSKIISKWYPNHIHDFFLLEDEKLARIPRIKHILIKWMNWRNRNRIRMHCLLALGNDVVSSSRMPQDLINAAGVDFYMMRVDKIISRLPDEERSAVFAVYGGKVRIGMARAAIRLSVHRDTLFNRLCMADRDIAEALDEIANNAENTKGKYRSDIFDEKVLYFRKIQRKERKTPL